MQLLYLSQWYPFPADNGIRIRIRNLVEALAQQHEVDFVSFTSETLTEERLAALRQVCRTVHVVVEQPIRSARFKSWSGFFEARPRSVAAADSPGMHACISALAEQTRYGAVIASELALAPYALRVPCRFRLLEDVELSVIHEQYSRARHWSRRARSWLTWWKFARYVSGLLRHFHAATAVSSTELAQLRQLAPPGVELSVIPNGVKVNDYPREPRSVEADLLVYSGAMTYAANFDAVAYFLSEILPLIQAQRPEARLQVTGQLEGVPLHRLPQRPGVTYTGYLPDVRPTIARSWASIAPLRLGAGTRLKILESLALGTPVVATTKGAEGLALEADHDLLLADTPCDFASAALKLLSDPDLRQRLSERGRETVAAHYDWDAIGRQLNEFLASVARRLPPTPAYQG